MSNEIPDVFHNGSNCNYHFIIKELPLRGETSAGRESFTRVKNSLNLRCKLSRMTSNSSFCKNLTFTNYYFKWQRLVILRYIKANLFQYSSCWPLRGSLCMGWTFANFLKNIFRRSNFNEFVKSLWKSWKFFS